MGEIRIEVTLGHPAELVWRALTERRLLARWFMPVDLEPRLAAPVGLRPSGLPGFDGPTEGEVVAVEAPHVLVMRWRAEHLRTLVTWRLLPAAGSCRLVVTQQGFLGVRGTQRQRELARTYRLLFAERLPRVLDLLAAGAPVDLLPVLAGEARVPRPAAPAYPDWRGGRRGGLALVVTALLAGATGAALAGLLPRRAVDPATVATAPHPTVTVTVPPRPEPTRPAPPPPPAGDAAPAAPPVAAPRPTGAVVDIRLPERRGRLAADFEHTGSALFGWSGAVTVRNTGPTAAAGWMATITLPPLAMVSRADVHFTQRGTTVTFAGAPLEPGTSTRFGFAVTLDATALTPLRAADAPLSCDVDGVACGGMSSQRGTLDRLEAPRRDPE